MEDELEGLALEIHVEDCTAVAFDRYGSIRQSRIKIVEFFLSREYGTYIIKIRPIQYADGILRIVLKLT